MKNISIVLTIIMSIFFVGCDLSSSDDFKEKDVKSILTSNNWYYIDKYTDKYTLANFTDESVDEEHYTDSSFTTVDYTEHYSIKYNGEKIYLTDDNGVEHTCSYTSCEDDNWMIISCDGGQPYIQGWTTKSLASSHAAK